MTGLHRASPRPTDITLHSESRVLEVSFSDGRSFRLPYEFLRVYSPSAEVRGHGPGQEQLQVGKRNVTIVSAEPVGHYGLQPTFSDGHNTGIYSWDLLYQFGLNQETLWAQYLERLQAAGATRDISALAPGTTADKPSASCGATAARPAEAADAAKASGH